MKIVDFGQGEFRRIAFWCPGCNSVKTVCPVRWNWNGDVDRPTLSPSILQTLGPFPDGHKEICHCFVRDGQIEFLNDCTHDKRGVMPLPELESEIQWTVYPNGQLGWELVMRFSQKLMGS